MKLGIAFVVISIILITDGTIRVLLGMAYDKLPLIMAGMATGWILGAYLLYRGIRRIKRLKAHNETN